LLELAAHGVTTDGVLPSVAPSEAHAYVTPAFNFAWVEGLWHYLRITGDRDFVRTQWGILVAMLNRFSLRAKVC
jgi:hypothetical protein